jgi:hypothetical protein
MYVCMYVNNNLTDATSMKSVPKHEVGSYTNCIFLLRNNFQGKADFQFLAECMATC